VWDGFQAQYSRGVSKALVGRFVHGQHKIEVLVYGGALPSATIVALLSAFIGGKWVKMTLNEVAGGAVIPKHQL